MFGFLKKKLSEVVDKIAGKVEDRQPTADGRMELEVPRPQSFDERRSEGFDGQPARGEVLQEERKPEEVTFNDREMRDDFQKGHDIQLSTDRFDEEQKPASLLFPEPITEAAKEATASEAETDEGLKEEYFKETQVEEFQRKTDEILSSPFPAAETVEVQEKPEPAAEKEEFSPKERFPDDEEMSFVSRPQTVEETRPAKKTEPAEPQEKKSFFEKITEKVVKKVTEKRLTEGDVEPILSDMESSLIESDVAVEVAEKIKGDLRSALVDREIKRGREKDVVIEAFRGSLMDILDVPRLDLGQMASQKRPVVIAFWGFNGVGKTTSLAKTASWLMGKGYTCVFAAADTFRAGAEEQLEIHANNLGVKLIKHKYGADPAAVIFDAVEHAKAKGVDFVLADTAGRTHTNANLMDQMRKIVRVNRPDLKVLVIDSLIGNDAVAQANMYNEVGVDALVFTKVDVNEKGGAILSVTHQLKKPIIFLGLGQDYSNFEEFDAKKFVDRILED